MHMQKSVSVIKNMQFIIPQDLVISEMKLKFAKNMPLSLLRAKRCLEISSDWMPRIHAAMWILGKRYGPLGFDYLVQTLDHCIDVALLAH